MQGTVVIVPHISLIAPLRIAYCPSPITIAHRLRKERLKIVPCFPLSTLYWHKI
ncbi:MAG: hypothetical protein PHF23_11170 [Smithellaceae bacterium]|nr:hypothetical protein [Smithellaceae bacterium]